MAKTYTKLSGLSVPLPGKKEKARKAEPDTLPVQDGGGVQVKPLSKDARKHLEALRLAQEAKPDSFDSKGKGYYLGPTVGQVLSWYFDERQDLFAKMSRMLDAGKTSGEVLSWAQAKHPELSEPHVEYVVRVKRNDAERWAAYLARVRERVKEAVKEAKENLPKDNPPPIRD